MSKFDKNPNCETCPRHAVALNCAGIIDSTLKSGAAIESFAEKRGVDTSDYTDQLSADKQRNDRIIQALNECRGSVSKKRLFGGMAINCSIEELLKSR